MYMSEWERDALKYAYRNKQWGFFSLNSRFPVKRVVLHFSVDFLCQVQGYHFRRATICPYLSFQIH
jgi:hypothetical protein